MSKTEKAILEAIRLDGAATAWQISESIHKSGKTVYRAIKRLKELG